jgi:hypothetical protein
MSKSILKRNFLASVLKIIQNPSLWKASFTCVYSIFKNFFILQQKAVIFHKKYPVSNVDHPLDEKIPFDPQWVDIYMDFSPFWVRTLGFLLENFGKDAVALAKDFLLSMAALYDSAALVYKKNMSTTNRPHYYGKFKFVVIHCFDPHLMCIPSLHVMVVIRTYTKFREYLRTLNGSERFASEIDFVRCHAVNITESILYVKQHSINCVAAGMYAMTSFDKSLFERQEALNFAEALFESKKNDSAIIEIKQYIASLYNKFLNESESSDLWTEPLLNFLKNLRK